MTDEWVAYFGALESILRSVRYRITSEDDLQRGIEHVLRRHEVEFEREAILSKKDRVDFLIQGGVALECKVAGSLSEVAGQLVRYAQHDRVLALVLVTTRGQQLRGMPEEFNGKPLHLVPILSGIV